jgi:hypothetical protein
MLPSPHFGRLMPHVLNVRGRTAIEIHAANSVRDLLGCIGVGDVRGPNFTLVYPTRLASDRLNAWLESWGGTAQMTVSYRTTETQGGPDGTLKV